MLGDLDCSSLSDVTAAYERVAKIVVAPTIAPPKASDRAQPADRCGRRGVASVMATACGDSLGIRHRGPSTAHSSIVERLHSGRGLRIYAVGGSVTANFAGCFGAGCHVPQHERAGDGYFSTSKNMMARGFLHSFMRELNATYPSSHHAVYNRGMSGHDCKPVASCVQSFVPQGAADLVLIDFSVNRCGAEKIQHIVAQLQLYRPPPVVVVAQNFWWCWGAEGTRSACSNASMALPGEVEAKRLQAASMVGDQLEIESFAASCGAVVLSAYYELLPRVERGELAPRQIAAGGVHPNTPLPGEPLIDAWIGLLRRWIGAASTSWRGAGAADCELAACPSRVVQQLEVSRSLRLCYGGGYPWLPALHAVRSSGFKFKRAAENAPGSYKPGWVSTHEGDTIDFGTGTAATGHNISVDVLALHSYANVSAACFGCRGTCSCASRWHNLTWRRRDSLTTVAVTLRVVSDASDGCLISVSNQPTENTCESNSFEASAPTTALGLADRPVAQQVKIDGLIVRQPVASRRRR